MHGLDLARWPAPAHLAGGLLGMPGMGWGALRAALRLLPGMLRPWALHGLSATHWLQNAGQGEGLFRRLWEPLCLATLNEPPGSADAVLLARVMRELFLAGPAAAQPLIPAADLNTTLIAPLKQAIEGLGGRITTRARVMALDLGGQRVRGAMTARGPIFHDGAWIVATPRRAAVKLLNPWSAAQPWAEGEESPIVSVHLRFAAPVALPAPMLGLPGCVSQWLFQPAPDRISAAISAAYREVHWESSRIVDAVLADLAAVTGDAPPPLRAQRVIKEARATFCAWPEAPRADPATPWENLHLAGDWTDTGLPATIEGAVISGEQAARRSR
ncbi:putative amine oxidase [Magnetofaba australis IT-1]|uniref:Putative amine oxidase n=1 Tax=Magnetofaba australis IT-1 TaxID=1434232 RepID=A0A1Y2K1J2_9PROT|nr:putative amine oxidase [Magnetofaba australis IT-1]